jgi:hypothetical protein
MISRSPPLGMDRKPISQLVIAIGGEAAKEIFDSSTLTVR